MHLLPLKERREYLIRYGRDRGLRLIVTRADATTKNPWVGFLWINHEKRRHRVYGPAIMSFRDGICIRRYYALENAIYTDLNKLGIQVLDHYPWFKDTVDEMAWLNEVNDAAHHRPV